MLPEANICVGEPARDCSLCPRLVAYRQSNAAAHPDWFNGAVAGFGSRDAQFLVVGMAPGVRGANRTGRPFTGDHAGILLFQSLLRFGFATGQYHADPADGLTLQNCRIVNAVRCVPPANLPTPVEIKMCKPFLATELASMGAVRVVLALGLLAHAAVMRACGLPLARHKFAHGALHAMPGGWTLANSYHVSRYNTNTGRLTTPMFEAVLADIRRVVDA